jgi:hypothetical protein
MQGLQQACKVAVPANVTEALFSVFLGNFIFIVQVAAFHKDRIEFLPIWERLCSIIGATLRTIFSRWPT